MTAQAALYLCRGGRWRSGLWPGAVSAGIRSQCLWRPGAAAAHRSRPAEEQIATASVFQVVGQLGCVSCVTLLCRADVAVTEEPREEHDRRRHPPCFSSRRSLKDNYNVFKLVVSESLSGFLSSAVDPSSPPDSSVCFRVSTSVTRTLQHVLRHQRIW